MAKGISCIIPAYNEGPRIGQVLQVVVGHDLLDEIIVVNDGSQDDTADVARSFTGVKVIDVNPNKGKSNAVLQGLKEARYDTIMLLDADLVGLTKENMTLLARPVVDEEVHMTICLSGNAPRVYRWFGLDFISGQRVFPKSVLGDPSALGGLLGFGIEPYMNSQIIAKQLPIAIVPWLNVTYVTKHEKQGFIKGLAGDLRMIAHILCTIGPVKCVQQMVALKTLSCKRAD